MSADWTGCSLLHPILGPPGRLDCLWLLPSTKLLDLALHAQGQPGNPPKNPSPLPVTPLLVKDLWSASHPSGSLSAKPLFPGFSTIRRRPCDQRRRTPTAETKVRGNGHTHSVHEGHRRRNWDCQTWNNKPKYNWTLAASSSVLFASA